ncbi:MAG: CPBP family intramembrane metalloprotease [Actinobacteria bacterium]|nr:CPBP family intramembrane metalloprotease [Actinomycetota bacterium]
MARPWRIVDFALVWLGGLAGALLAVTVTDLGTLDDTSLVVVGLAGQYVGNFVVLGVLARRRQSLRMTLEPGDVRYVALGILAQIAVAILLEPLARVLFPDGRPPQQIAEIISDPSAALYLKLAMFGAAVLLAPLAEELMFRGVLLRAIEPWSRWTAIGVTASVFAAVHLLGVDPERFWASALVVAPPILALGVWLGWLTMRKGRLGPAIFLHSGWNLVAAVVLLLPPEMLEPVG